MSAVGMWRRTASSTRTGHTSSLLNTSADGRMASITALLALFFAPWAPLTARATVSPSTCTFTVNGGAWPLSFAWALA